MHSSRRARIDELTFLVEKGQFDQAYRLHVIGEWPYETLMGLQLSLLRLMADPIMARRLSSAGALTDRPLHRTLNTGLLLYQLIYDGLDAPDSRRLISYMNRAHKGRRIPQKEFAHVLAALMVVPIRYIEAFGWRQVIDPERTAALEFYTRLGSRMGIKWRPKTFAEAEAFLDVRDQDHIAFSVEGQELTRNIVSAFQDRVPAIMRPMVPYLIGAQTDTPRLNQALGLPDGGLTGRAASASYTWVRRSVLPFLRARVNPAFVPGQALGSLYPDGYTLADLIA